VGMAARETRARSSFKPHPRTLSALSTILLATFLVRAEGRTDRIIADWKERMIGIEQALHAKDYATAAESSSELARDMLERITKGGSSAQVLGRLSVYQAIAATALGERDEGLWRWRTAQILDPRIVDVDLSQLGPIPAQLKAVPFRGQFPPDRLYLTLPPGCTKPKLRRHPRALYPEAMVDLDIEARYLIEFVVDTDGSVKEPILRSRVEEPAFVYSLLDALRRYTFKPAMIDGQAVAVVFTMEMTFDIKH